MKGCVMTIEGFWRLIAVWNLVMAASLIAMDQSTWLVLLAVVCAASSAFFSAEAKVQSDKEVK